jgi:hypothetical protein
MEKEIKKSDGKLEAKHIAPYLPYKLNFWHTKLRDKRELTQIKVRKDGDVLVDIESDTLVYISSINDSWIKPILRPMSDLIKKIQTSEGEIIPIEGMFLPCGERDVLTSWAEQNKCWLGTQVSYLVYQHLFELHFDVFGLIEKGLAVDINTI